MHLLLLLGLSWIEGTPAAVMQPEQSFELSFTSAVSAEPPEEALPPEMVQQPVFDQFLDPERHRSLSDREPEELMSEESFPFVEKQEVVFEQHEELLIEQEPEEQILDEQPVTGPLQQEPHPGAPEAYALPQLPGLSSSSFPANSGMITRVQGSDAPTAGSVDELPLSDLDSAAANVNLPMPPYPRAAREQGLEGTLLIEMIVSTSGAVASAELIESSGSEILDRICLETVLERWDLGSRPEILRIRKRFVFRLHE